MSDLRDEEHRTPIARPQATPEPEVAGEPQLKPCPKCGAEAVMVTGEWDRSSETFSRAECSDDACGFGDTVHRSTPTEAAAAWNRRPVEDQQAAEIAALRERLAKVERERDDLIMAWPTATDADVWEEETPDAVARQRDGKWCVMSRDLGVFATREAAVRAAAGLAGAEPKGVHGE